MSLSTYDIQRLAHELVDTLEDSEGETTDDLDARLAEFEGEASDKLERLFYVRARLRTEEAHEEAHRKSRQKRRDRIRKTLERIEGYSLTIMLANEALTGDVKHAGDGFKVKVSTSQRVEILPAALSLLAETRPDLASLYVKADKTKVKKALKAGEEIPGCSLTESTYLRWT